MNFKAMESTDSTFKPLTLAITFDKVSQLNAFYALFAHSDICIFMRDHGFDPTPMRYEIDGVNGEPKYGDAFTQLRKLNSL